LKGNAENLINNLRFFWLEDGKKTGVEEGESDAIQREKKRDNNGQKNETSQK